MEIAEHLKELYFAALPAVNDGLNSDVIQIGRIIGAVERDEGVARRQRSVILGAVIRNSRYLTQRLPREHPSLGHAVPEFLRLPENELSQASTDAREIFFSWLADFTYASSDTVVPSYKSTTADMPDNRDFNYCLAKSRVRIEHAIGVMMMRWYSCIEMRSRLNYAKGMLRLIRWVLACVILHNALAQLGDRWADLSELEDVEPDRIDERARDDVIDNRAEATNARTRVQTTTLALGREDGTLLIA
ncbi:hypothetical protein PsorP6_012921 [Peronosclerospora sorghi]|uniref:Uncharacterized protein n=1 Tax=Peronosclerospora sorghi TaxID=230839 RepID=A0ACC0WH63_9STRA|nr:hypothetical protein PsorP6_012921 [Peronosclerospora sorghi]